jgi:hypothetical protein
MSYELCQKPCKTLPDACNLLDTSIDEFGPLPLLSAGPDSQEESETAEHPTLLRVCRWSNNESFVEASPYEMKTCLFIIFIIIIFKDADQNEQAF